MPGPDPRRSPVSFAPVLALAIGGIGLVLWATSRYGAGLTPDAAAYISAARSLLAGDGYLRYSGLPFVTWPPLFPTLIGIPGTVGVDAIDATRYINAGLFGAILLASAYWLRSTVRSPLLICVGALAILLSRPLLLTSVHAWSEPAFILWVILFLLSIQRFLQRGTAGPFSLAILFAALAWLTRYVGVTVLATGIILLLTRPRAASRVRIAQAAGFAILVSLPMAFWLLRNHALTGTLTGVRLPSQMTLLQIVGYAIGTLAEWFLPSLLGILLLAVASGRKPAANTSRGMRPAIIFSVLYTGTLLMMAAAYGSDGPGHRLLSPVFVPLLVLVVTAVDRCYAGGDGRSSGRQFVILSIVGAVLWLGFPIVDTAARVSSLLRDGTGTYSSSHWADSDLVAYLRANPQAGPVYSNAPDALYVLAGVRADFVPIKFVGGKHDGDSTNLRMFISQLGRSDTARLIWFNDIRRDYRYSLTELGSVCAMECLATYSHGTVYSIWYRDRDGVAIPH